MCYDMKQAQEDFFEHQLALEFLAEFHPFIVKRFTEPVFLLPGIPFNINDIELPF